MSELPRLAAGTMLDGRYRVDDLLSVGGMGAVYAGSHTLLHRRVAIKVLRTDLPDIAVMIDRFRREAIAASAIGHENIVQVTDMGTAPGGTPYLVMELLEGRSLNQAIESDAPMPVDRACQLMCGVLRGLDAAHQAGIVHRDLKPDNVFLVRANGGEIAKLLDFGVSLLERPDLPSTRLTSTGTVLGTPRYMSPEQARGEHALTAAIDIYAAGVVLYEMLTGELPYVGDNYNVVIHEIISGSWVPIESQRDDVPLEVSDAIRRALALSPDDRFARADDMAAVLAPFAAAAPVPAPVQLTTSRAAHGTASAVTTGQGGRSGSSQSSPANPDRSTAALAMTKQLKPGNSGWSSQTPGREPLRLKGDSQPDPAWTGSKRPRASALERTQFDDEMPPRTRHESSSGRYLLVGVVLAAAAAVAAFMVVRSRQHRDSGGAAQAGEPGPGPGLTARTAGGRAQATAAPDTHPSSVGRPVSGRADADKKAHDLARADAAEKAHDRAGADAAEKAHDLARADAARKAADQKRAAQAHARGEVTVSFLVVPPSAMIITHRGSMSGHKLEIQKSRRKVEVVVQAAGYQSKTLHVVPNHDQEILVQLLPVADSSGDDDAVGDPPADKAASGHEGSATSAGTDSGSIPAAEAKAKPGSDSTPAKNSDSTPAKNSDSTPAKNSDSTPPKSESGDKKPSDPGTSPPSSP